MKQLFAIFCAIFLAPTFHSHAWIGGPFSNNSYFGESGDDGIYEAVATGPNAIGIYRIVIANDFAGSSELDTGLVLLPGLQGFNSIDFGANSFGDFAVPAINSGNIFIGGFGLNEAPASNIWYFEGVSYFGRTSGSVNSALGVVFAVGNAPERGGGGRFLDSSFSAVLNNAGDLLPASSFTGAGEASETTGGTSFTFNVLGSKVSSQITFGL